MKKENPTLKKLQAFAADLLEDYKKSGELKLSIPIRSTSNIKYDKKLRQYIIGDKTKELDIRNITQSRALTQRLWLVWFVKRLLEEDKTTTMRDVYYSAMNADLKFDDQAQNDQAIFDIEAALSLAREEMHIMPKKRGSIFGPLTIEYTTKGWEGQEETLTKNPNGFSIEPSLVDADFKKCTADKIIVMEKDAMFKRGIEDGAHKKYNAVIIGFEGQASRNIKTLTRRLTTEFKLPCYVYCDYDPYGAQIANSFIFGSAGLSHIKELNVPDAQWCGMYSSDVKKYKLPTLPFTETDVKKVADLERDPRFQTGVWKEELETFARDKRKAELEAFNVHGLSYVIDVYLKDKLKELSRK